MRYAIFSDVHSNLEAFNAVMTAYKSENIERFLCVGDIVGYGVNPQECIAKIKELSIVTIAGNHDWAGVNLFSLDYFNPDAKTALLWTRQNLNETDKLFLESLRLVYKNEDLTLVHGTLDNPQDFNYLTDAYIAEETFRLITTNICFVGHTHVPGIFSKDKSGHIYYRQDSQFYLNEDQQYIVNVGSVGQPRDANPLAAYCIYDTDKKEILIKRVSYDVQAARRKIIDKGLPEFLGDRILIGR